jgi:hypothetical protein
MRKNGEDAIKEDLQYKWTRRLRTKQSKKGGREEARRKNKKEGRNNQGGRKERERICVLLCGHSGIQKIFAGIECDRQIPEAWPGLRQT